MRSDRLLGSLVIGASVIVAAIVFALVGDLLGDAGGTATEVALARLERQLAEQQAQFQTLEEEVADLRRDRAALRDQLARTPEAPAPGPSGLPSLPTDQFGGAAPLPGELVERSVIVPDRFNRGIIAPRPEVVRELLGEPRETYSQDCQSVTNPALAAALETRKIGSFSLTMLRPALDSFERIMQRLQTEDPVLYAEIGTAGALCVRHVRGRPGSVSSHAWGIAVDLTLVGELDPMGDGATQFGLADIAEYFNEAGWYWGGAYEREDSMHFEVGEALLRQWKSEGQM